MGWDRGPFTPIIIRVLQEEKNGNIITPIQSQQNGIRSSDYLAKLLTKNSFQLDLPHFCVNTKTLSTLIHHAPHIKLVVQERMTERKPVKTEIDLRLRHQNKYHTNQNKTETERKPLSVHNPMLLSCISHSRINTIFKHLADGQPFTPLKLGWIQNN